MARVKVRKTVSLVDLSTSTKLFIDNYNYQINKRNKIDNKAYIYSGVCLKGVCLCILVMTMVQKQFWKIRYLNLIQISQKQLMIRKVQVHRMKMAR